MVTTDPIADLLTRIRNALSARFETVSVPFSRIKKAIADILADEGYVKSAEVAEENGKKNIKIALKYGYKEEKIITALKRVSSPGLRVYKGYGDMPKVLNGMGVAIVSTSKGIMTDRKARAAKIGGEVLAYVW